MQRLFILSIIFLLTVSAKDCNEKKETGKLYKARLEIKAMCMNYTIKLLEGNISPAKINSTWTNETTGKSYTNVFGLANPCSFPVSINEGDEFYFVLDSSKTKPCAVCMLYYPVPEKKLSIRIVNK
jgi:hypothetical protein